MKRLRLSLLQLLALTVIVSIAVTLSIESAMHYQSMRDSLIDRLKSDSEQQALTLANSISGFIQAFSPNEYDQLIRHHMDDPKYLSIIVADDELGQLIGDGAFITGKLRDPDWRTIDFDPDNPQHEETLDNSFHKVQRTISNSNGQKLGTLSLYLSDREIKHQLRALLIDQLVTTTLMSLALLALQIAIFYPYALKPLSRITKQIQNTDNEGIPLNTVHVSGLTEITSLSQIINRMIRTVSRSRTSLLEQKKIIQHQANHDVLTGLGNRYLFNDRLNQALLRAERHQSMLAILFIDLDHFKQVNDSYGHKVGDRLLIEVAGRLQGILRKVDTLARFGGDEFVLLVEEINDAHGAAILSEKIQNTVSKQITIDHYDIFIGCSIGISLYPQNGRTSQDLLKQADLAMYKAKDEGRNTFRFFNAELTQTMLERLTLETQLHTAILNDEFVVYYQPQVNIETGMLSGLEALVRWNNPKKGLMTPDQFIPTAESCGKMVDIDRLVMSKAIQQISAWRKSGVDPGTLALNLTLQHLLSRDFIPRLESMLEQAGCGTECIELEITEGHIMSRPEETIAMLHKLHDAGIRLALDDFGTGYSSLGYLKSLPVDRLKIDRSFIEDLPGDQDSIAIVRSIVELARSLNLKILVEGVETQAQAEILHDLGCTHMQGYYYGRPQPLNEIQTQLQVKHPGDFSKTVMLNPDFQNTRVQT